MSKEQSYPQGLLLLSKHSFFLLRIEPVDPESFLKGVPSPLIPETMSNLHL